MRWWRAVAFVALIGLASAAGAQTLPDKLCGVSVAQKLPNVPGAAISGISFKPLDRRAAASRAVAQFRTLLAAAQDLDRSFPMLNAALLTKLQGVSSYDVEARSDLIERVVNQVADAVEVSADLRVAGFTIVYVGSCLRGVNGAIYATMDGAAR